MNNIFRSATLQLTGWFLLIILIVSVSFSVLIYRSATNALHSGLTNYSQTILKPLTPSGVLDGSLFDAEAAQVRSNLLVSLVYINVLILLMGGAASYLLARRTLQSIEETHAAQLRFTSDASHELRTPLATMKLELEAAFRDKSLKKEELRELLASNLEEVDKLSLLTHTLLKLSRKDYLTLERQSVDLAAVLESAMQTHKQYASRLTFEKTPKELVVHANVPSLEELFSILIDNALKYSQKDTVVRMKLTQKGRYGQFTIYNEGKGISAEDMPHIFRRFYRSDSARTSEGHGLGLSLAKQIIELHNGELTVSSREGEFTRFTVTLPLERTGFGRK